MIGVISDVHGNYPALKAVLEDMDSIGCKEVISLGDICGYYCMINECIDEMHSRNIVNILGNHDSYIVNGTSCGRSNTANRCLDYQRKVLKNNNLEWIKKSVPYIKRDSVWMVHGGWNDYVDEYIKDFSFLDRKSQTKLYISGHTHVQKEVKGKYATYINPGSVGQPRDGECTAAYAIIEDGKWHLRRVKYDIDAIVLAMKQAGFGDYETECLYYGRKIGEKHG